MDEGLSFGWLKQNPSTYVGPDTFMLCLEHWEGFELIFIAVMLTTCFLLGQVLGATWEGWKQPTNRKAFTIKFSGTNFGYRLQVEDWVK